MNNNYTKLGLKGPPAVPVYLGSDLTVGFPSSSFYLLLLLYLFLPPLADSFLFHLFSFFSSIFFFSLNIGLDLAWTGGQTGTEGTL